MPKDTRWTKSVLVKAKGSRESRLRRFVDNVAVQFIAFGAFVAALVAIMTAGFDVRDRVLNDSIVGQVAPFTIEATRDFSFSEKDHVASNRLREEVALSVPSVYDWQESLSETLRDDVRKAFSGMRQAMAEEIRESLETQAPARLEEIVAQGDGTTIAARVLLESVTVERRSRLGHQLRADHFDTIVKLRISDNDFDAFARRGFPVDVENVLAAMVAEAMSHLIVANVRRMERESEHGIYLRRLRDDKLLIEYHVTDLGDRFVGPDGIPRLIEEAARREMISVHGADLRQAILATATLMVRPNTTFNEAKTLEKRKTARDSVADQILSEEFRKGQIVVDKGHIVTERHYRIIQKMLEDEESLQQTQILAGVAVLCLLLLMTLFVFGRKNVRRFQPRPKDIVFMGTTLLMMLLFTRMGTAMSHAIAEQSVLIPVQAWYFAIPVAAGGMLIRLVLNSEHAIIFTILFCILVGMIAENSLFFTAYTALGTLVGITTVQHVKHRMALMWSGLAVGAVNAVSIVAFALIGGELFQVATLLQIGLGFAGGLAAGFFLSAVLPLFEAVFSYTTDIKLLELANLNHPLLRELILRSPGSYHHSMMVGSLCESAAESIGCNPLLARVGSYYHDIGKAKNPQYFAENQRINENPHDKLKPNMSALIIKSHVKDGLDMARQNRLPVEIQDFIAQHHGTSLIAYFYHRAKEQEDPDIPEVDEKDYRYPGPKPQSRETAICLLADSIEAASRSLPNPSPARLKGLVQTMINKAFTDGQLDECDLTLKDLNSIAKAFTRILTGIYHHRPEYPGQNQGSKKDADKESTRQTQEIEGRKQKTTKKQRVVTASRLTTDSVPGAIARPHPTQETSTSEGLSAADSSSDVWEIAQEAVEDEPKVNDARRDNAARKGEEASRDKDDPSDDSTKPRRALPRLGTP
ncbi:MAG: HDIG domain-containing protein [Bradymonadaceae bacterium]|nr:HDIG domain-containing protein [Lujinxingiaceae bacterium]